MVGTLAAILIAGGLLNPLVVEDPAPVVAEFTIEQEMQYIHDPFYRAEINSESVQDQIQQIIADQKALRHEATVQLAREREEREVRARAAAEAARIEAARVAAIKAAEAAAAEEARIEAGRDWVSPVSDYRITATFDQAGGRWARNHTGIDLAAPTGTKVRSISSGKVIFAGNDGAYGNKIAIEHWDGTVSWYCHLDSFDVQSGRVQTGDLIGRIGTTGNTTGPHLHLEIHPGGGDAVNPRSWLADHGVDL